MGRLFVLKRTVYFSENLEKTDKGVKTTIPFDKLPKELLDKLRIENGHEPLTEINVKGNIIVEKGTIRFEYEDGT